jgi:hypothetical protein
MSRERKTVFEGMTIKGEGDATGILIKRCYVEDGQITFECWNSKRVTIPDMSIGTGRTYFFGGPGLPKYIVAPVTKTRRSLRTVLSEAINTRYDMGIAIVLGALFYGLAAYLTVRFIGPLVPMAWVPIVNILNLGAK